jgi:hypothetical protein
MANQVGGETCGGNKPMGALDIVIPHRRVDHGYDRRSDNAALNVFDVPKAAYLGYTLNAVRLCERVHSRVRRAGSKASLSL